MSQSILVVDEGVVKSLVAINENLAKERADLTNRAERTYQQSLIDAWNARTKIITQKLETLIGTKWDNCEEEHIEQLNTVPDYVINHLYSNPEYFNKGSKVFYGWILSRKKGATNPSSPDDIVIPPLAPNPQFDAQIDDFTLRMVMSDQMVFDDGDQPGFADYIHTKAEIVRKQQLIAELSKKTEPEIEVTKPEAKIDFNWEEKWDVFKAEASIFLENWSKVPEETKKPAEKIAMVLVGLVALFAIF